MKRIRRITVDRVIVHLPAAAPDIAPGRLREAIQEAVRARLEAGGDRRRGEAGGAAARKGGAHVPHRRLAEAIAGNLARTMRREVES